LLPLVSRAGEWFLRSGIQTPDGGVARYYRLDVASNLPVSTEITGYSLSALLFLHSVTNDARYLDAARHAARYLTAAWDASTRSMPYETNPAELTYFFDCGIIVRGLLAAWRASGDEAFFHCAREVGDSMARDFAAAGQFHPILALPGKQPVERDPLSWSRDTGCYQLKAGMAWWDLWEATGEVRYQHLYQSLLHDGLRTWTSFLPGHPERRRVVDRLHAFLYFLEGLLPVANDAPAVTALCQGIQRVEHYTRELAPEFERSDVYAQLLRVRLFADWAGAVPLDRAAGQWEATRIAEFAVTDDDPRIDGGFYFGRSAGAWEPYVNPVSTAFAVQALALWDGRGSADRLLI
jgi:hypothetical protein